MTANFDKECQPSEGKHQLNKIRLLFSVMYEIAMDGHMIYDSSILSDNNNTCQLNHTAYYGIFGFVT